MRKNVRIEIKCRKFEQNSAARAKDRKKGNCMKTPHPHRNLLTSTPLNARNPFKPATSFSKLA